MGCNEWGKIQFFLTTLYDAQCSFNDHGGHYSIDARSGNGLIIIMLTVTINLLMVELPHTRVSMEEDNLPFFAVIMTFFCRLIL